MANYGSLDLKQFLPKPYTAGTMLKMLRNILSGGATV